MSSAPKIVSCNLAQLWNETCGNGFKTHVLYRVSRRLPGSATATLGL